MSTKAKAPAPKKPKASKPATNPFLAEKERQLDKSAKAGSKGSPRGGR